MVDNLKVLGKPYASYSELLQAYIAPISVCKNGNFSQISRMILAKIEKEGKVIINYDR
jgi:hypothetical protein